MGRHFCGGLLYTVRRVDVFSRGALAKFLTFVQLLSARSSPVRDIDSPNGREDLESPRRICNGKRMGNTGTGLPPTLDNGIFDSNYWNAVGSLPNAKGRLWAPLAGSHD